MIPQVQCDTSRAALPQCYGILQSHGVIPHCLYLCSSAPAQPTEKCLVLFPLKEEWDMEVWGDSSFSFHVPNLRVSDYLITVSFIPGFVKYVLWWLHKSKKVWSCFLLLFSSEQDASWKVKHVEFFKSKRFRKLFSCMCHPALPGKYFINQ